MHPPIQLLPAAGVTFCGRTFSPADLGLMRQVVADCSGLAVTEIARTICELLPWTRPNGHLKNHECRQLLEQLHAQGWVQLPTVRALGPRGPRRVVPTSRSDPQPVVQGSAAQYDPLRLSLVAPGEESALWREYLARYHYLGYRVPVGASLRYLVRSERESASVLACLSWSSPAWKMAARDRWIGWSDPQRVRNLPYIVNNSRFLMLPWVRVKNLASKILALCARQLPDDWEQSYGYRPLLLETLVDAGRFAGTCYRAANWTWLGQTQGRGRMDREHRAQGRAPKLIYVASLCRQAQRRLCTAPSPHACDGSRDLGW